MSQNIPIALKEKEKYLMFLNQVGNQDLYESSSSSYSIIPVKDEIHILKINRKTNDPINLDDEIENYDLIFVSEKDIVESVMSVMEECYKGILNRESPKLLIDDYAERHGE